MVRKFVRLDTNSTKHWSFGLLGKKNKTNLKILPLSSLPLPEQRQGIFTTMWCKVTFFHCFAVTYASLKQTGKCCQWKDGENFWSVPFILHYCFIAAPAWNGLTLLSQIITKSPGQQRWSSFSKLSIMTLMLRLLLSVPFLFSSVKQWQTYWCLSNSAALIISSHWIMWPLIFQILGVCVCSDEVSKSICGRKLNFPK